MLGCAGGPAVVAVNRLLRAVGGERRGRVIGGGSIGQPGDVPGGA
jgi:hypothetical protein